jgi:hypothetical protein
MFQKSPAQTAFWTFIESSRYITGMVIYWMVFQLSMFIFSLRYFKRIFSAKNRVFKRNIFGGTPTFQKFYFRRRREFSFIFICLNRAELVFLTFDDGIFRYVWRRMMYLCILSLCLLLCLRLLPP